MDEQFDSTLISETQVSGVDALEVAPIEAMKLVKHPKTTAHTRHNSCERLSARQKLLNQKAEIKRRKNNDSKNTMKIDEDEESSMRI